MLAPPPFFHSSHPEGALQRLSPLGPSDSLVRIPAAGDNDLGHRIACHNEANRETCGYLELIPILKEVAFDPQSDSEHVQTVGYRLNTEPGRYVTTGNPAHVAVQRGGFFAVKLPTGEEQFTRVGRMVLDAQRRLCIDLGDCDLPLTPEIKLPEGATRFSVQSGQLNVEVDGQQEPTTVGPLQVVEFFDASRLSAVGGSLYRETIASGPPKPVVAELVMETLEFPAGER